MQISL
jgi:hypothetical protein